MIGIQHRAATTAFRFFLFAILACIAACSGGGGGGGSSSSGPVVAPVIVVQPQSQTVADGQPVTFSVAATGTSLTYQWSRNGAAIAGATGSTYTIPTAQLSDTGATFTVVVSNSAGSVQSATATLTVNLAPPTITNNTARTISVTVGSTATLTVTATGSAPLAFQWRRGGAPIAGATSATYTTPATTLADNGATFDVVVTNAAGTATSALYTLAVTTSAVAPGIGTQPQSTTVRAGDTATFSVVATGTAPLSYQWLRNGTPIAGAQSATYALTGASLGDNGAQLSVTVTNAAGSATSGVATLTVLPQVGIALLAGDIGGPGFIDGPGMSARLTSSQNTVVDPAGNVYFADTSTIRRLGTDGNVVTVAGSAAAGGTADGGALTTARLQQPSGLAIDTAGNVFFTEIANINTVRMLTPAGNVVTVAGTHNVIGSADGTGAAASFNNPTGLAIDRRNGILYVSDTNNDTIRKIAAGAVVTTLAGSAGTAGSADGTGAAATFNGPRQLVVDSTGNVFVADAGNHTIRKVTPAGVVTTFAGAAGAPGSADGTGAAARFNIPAGMAIDAADNLYVSEAGSLDVRKITPTGVVSHVAGSGTAGFADGTGTAAQFSAPLGLSSDASGTLYVADVSNYSIRRVTPAGVVSTVAGAPILQGTTDAAGAAARFTVPIGVTVDGALNVFVADNVAHTIRKITASGVVTTIAGLGGTSGSADGTGAAARFNMPQGIVVDGSGTLYVADRNNHTIRKVTASGVVTTIAGQAGVPGFADGAGSAARFSSPAGITIDAAGNLYVTDNNPAVRKITPAGVVTTLAGGAGRVGAVDGPGNVASFNFPQQISVDTAGNLYVADTSNAIIRKVTPAGVVSTVAGVAGATGANDGTAATARFTLPTGIAVDRSGNLFVSDIGTHTVRKIDVAGNVTTIAGVADGLRGVKLGGLPGHLDLPVELAVDANGTLYVADVNAILRIALP